MDRGEQPSGPDIPFFSGSSLLGDTGNGFDGGAGKEFDGEQRSCQRSREADGIYPDFLPRQSFHPMGKQGRGCLGVLLAEPISIPQFSRFLGRIDPTTEMHPVVRGAALGEGENPLI